MIVGIVARNQIPMFFTFEEGEAQYISDVLADSLERSYQVIDMFLPKDYFEEDGEL